MGDGRNDGTVPRHRLCLFQGFVSRRHGFPHLVMIWYMCVLRQRSVRVLCTHLLENR